MSAVARLLCLPAYREISGPCAFEAQGNEKTNFKPRSRRVGGEELKERFAMLQIRIYDAQTHAGEENCDHPIELNRSFAGARAAFAALGARNEPLCVSAVRLRFRAQDLRRFGS
ncbi:hypothetical protein [Bradyrhizobium sp. NC92]|uniref:hypothetical protein n=1 Tax=Bradyrhizobium sp. (strain NC92) TaxID=55395 RepID=UPI0021A99949|nr:hypothetical protein [Bradyrhizobium sp. NC92]UWU68190.1 hypothetical protein N2602_34675 [Bradyrhizobium sp. NC92]